MKKLNGESGQTLILVALCMTGLLGFAGLATDVGVMLHEKRQIQAAADSAALGAAAALLAGGTADSATAAGQNDAANYGFTASEVTINVPPADDVNAAFNHTGYVEAVVIHKTNTFLMNLFGQSSETIKARAVATDQITGGGCFTALNPAKSDPAVDLSGNSLVEATHCGANINGNLTMQGSSDIQIGNLGVSGNINYVGNGSSIQGTYSSGAPPVGDPMAQLSQPENEPTVSGTTCTAPPASGLSNCFVNHALGASMTSGMYVFTQAPTFSGNALSVTGSGPIVIYLSGSIPFAFNKNLTATLNAPGAGSGALTGVLIDAPNDVATNNDCTKGNGKNASTNGTLFFDFGSSSITLNGAIYAPQAHLFLQDEGASVTLNADLDIGTVCQQSANLTISAQSGASAPIKQIGLVE